MVAIFDISKKYFIAKLYFVLLVTIFVRAALAIGIKRELTQNFVPCRDGWYLYGEKCYKVQGESENQLKWMDASVQCSQEGGHLVTIESKQMRDFIFTFLLLNAGSDAWIGLHVTENTKYVWDDGSALKYTDWDSREPSKSRHPWENCILMRFWNYRKDIGSWNDYDCTNKLPYICQLKKDDNLKNPDPRFCSVEKGGGWKYLNSCYHIVNEKMTWEDAEEYCQENFNGHLATILDFRPEYFLNYILLNGVHAFWIGIKIREGTQQKWSSGWQVIFNRWADEKFTKDTCALREGEKLWKAVPCSQKNSFVCETSTDKPPIEENGHCPESSKDWMKANGKFCYLFDTNTTGTWFEANDDCVRKGGALVTTHSKEELNNLYVQLRPKLIDGTVFIGLHRKLSNKNEFEWADGSKVDYENWFPDEPKDIRKECGGSYIQLMRWRTMSCLDKLLYICSARKIKGLKNTTKQIESTLKGYIFPKNSCAKKEATVTSNKQDCKSDCSSSNLLKNTGSEEKEATTSENTVIESVSMVIETSTITAEGTKIRNVQTIHLTKARELDLISHVARCSSIVGSKKDVQTASEQEYEI